LSTSPEPITCIDYSNIGQHNLTYLKTKSNIPSGMVRCQGCVSAYKGVKECIRELPILFGHGESEDGNDRKNFSYTVFPVTAIYSYFRIMKNEKFKSNC